MLSGGDLGELHNACGTGSFTAVKWHDDSGTSHGFYKEEQYINLAKSFRRSIAWKIPCVQWTMTSNFRGVTITDSVGQVLSLNRREEVGVDVNVIAARLQGMNEPPTFTNFTLEMLAEWVIVAIGLARARSFTDVGIVDYETHPAIDEYGRYWVYERQNDGLTSLGRMEPTMKCAIAEVTVTENRAKPSNLAAGVLCEIRGVVDDSAKLNFTGVLAAVWSMIDPNVVRVNLNDVWKDILWTTKSLEQHATINNNGVMKWLWDEVGVREVYEDTKKKPCELGTLFGKAINKALEFSLNEESLPSIEGIRLEQILVMDGLSVLVSHALEVPILLTVDYESPTGRDLRSMEFVEGMPLAGVLVGLTVRVLCGTEDNAGHTREVIGTSPREVLGFLNYRSPIRVRLRARLKGSYTTSRMLATLRRLTNMLTRSDDLRAGSFCLAIKVIAQEGVKAMGSDCMLKAFPKHESGSRQILVAFDSMTPIGGAVRYDTPHGRGLCIDGNLWYLRGSELEGWHLMDKVTQGVRLGSYGVMDECGVGLWVQEKE